MGWLVPLLALACSRPAVDPDPKPAVVASPAPRLMSKRELIATGRSGFSSLALAPDATLWTGPEKGDVVVPLVIEGPSARIKKPLPVPGLGSDMDVEALAFTADGNLLLATEGDADGRDSDDLIELKTGEGGLEIKSRVSLPYALWKIQAEGNRGIEAVCVTGTHWVAGVETVQEHNGERFGPVAMWDTAAGVWTPYRVRLTTDTGKFSAFACRETEAGRVEVTAVERHFGVARLVRFELDGKPHPDSGVRDVRGESVADLAPLIPGVPNMEGIEYHPEGGYWIITDNDYGGPEGPTLLLHVVVESTPNSD